MNLSAEHTKLLNNTAQICLSKLIGEQNAIIRFVWCCVDKIHLCSSSLKILIPLIEKDDTLEFSVGIILRSMLMDCILIERVVGILDDHILNGQINFDMAYIAIDKQCLLYVADGTNKLIDMLYEDETIPLKTRIEVCRNMANQFPRVFDTNNNKPKLSPEFNNVVLHNEYTLISNKQKKHKTIYNNYKIYSKYDHVSHWSSEFRNIPIKNRHIRIESSLSMIILSMRELLKLPYLFGVDLKKEISDIMTNIDCYFKSIEPNKKN